MARGYDNEKEPRAWVSWQVYVDRILDEKEKALKLAFDAARDNLTLLAKTQAEALGLAAQAVKEKMQELNNLRKEYTDDRSKLVSIEKYEGDRKSDTANREADLKRIAALENWQARMIGVFSVVAFAAGIMGAIIAHSLKIGGN